MNCDIDSAGAGRFADVLDEGAMRFCQTHPGEMWEISGVVVPCGLSLNANNGKRNVVAKVLPPVLDMADSVFEALEIFRSSH